MLNFGGRPCMSSRSNTVVVLEGSQVQVLLLCQVSFREHRLQFSSPLSLGQALGAALGMLLADIG